MRENRVIEVEELEVCFRLDRGVVVDAVKGITFNNRQLTAVNSMAIVIDITGSGSVAATTGSATVTVSYAKLPASKQEY